MNIALAQLNYHIGNFEANTQKIIKAIHEAKEQKAELIVFSELAVCGYPPCDFLEFSHFITLCTDAIKNIAQHTHNIGVLVGAPAINPKKEGKDLYNAAYYLYEGEVKNIIYKTLLPTYDVFDEYRYFEPNKKFEIITHKQCKIAVSICEDIWNVGNENPLYTVAPIDELISQKPDCIINLSASPFAYDQAIERKNVIKANVKRYGIPMLYCNQVGAQTELIFDGGSLAISQHGVIYDEMPYFESCVKTYSLQNITDNKTNTEQESNKEALIYKALICGIKDYFTKTGLTKATLGLSGGIDSVLTTVLAVAALGKDNVLPVLMPSEYSSSQSVSDSEQLCKNLGLAYKIVPIKEVYNSFNNTLQPFFEGLPPNVTEENLQARSRAVILMAFCNKLGYILLNTTNKSEAAVGYGTLYGDMCGGIGVLGDLYKTEIYALAKYINRNEEIIPFNCITKAPSAELKPNQKDSDSLPEYNILDPLLYQYIHNKKSPDEIIALGYEKDLVHKVLKLVNMAEHKRHQTPPILRVSHKAFGKGRRMPIVAKYLS